MKNANKWTDWLFLVLFLSVVLLIFKEGLIGTIFIWGYYIYSGWKYVKKYPSESNIEEFMTQVLIGIIVVIIVIVINVILLFT